jgi:hypothetical protein
LIIDLGVKDISEWGLRISLIIDGKSGKSEWGLRNVKEISESPK